MTEILAVDAYAQTESSISSINVARLQWCFPGKLGGLRRLFTHTTIFPGDVAWLGASTTYQPFETEQRLQRSDGEYPLHFVAPAQHELELTIGEVGTYEPEITAATKLF